MAMAGAGSGPGHSHSAPMTGAGAAEGQTYCLRWNNHQTNLVQILHALHEVGSYVDCTIVVDDEQFKAHRVVLAANSPYFQTILQDVPQDHCSIILPGVKGFEIAALLQYMYTGETTVTKSQEPEILRTAKELQVKGLYDNLMKFNHKLSSSDAAAVYQGRLTPPQPVNSCSSASSTSCKPATTLNGGDAGSASVISTSMHISPSAAISSSCSPPPPPPPGYGAYQPPYTNLYRKSPTPTLHPHINSAGETPLTPTHAATAAHAAAVAAEAGQWPLSPSAAAAAMLNSVYESASDMNPLKRKKLSAISSMFMNRDTPILRNVLAQANTADSSQPNPLLLPGVFKSEKNATEKTPTHQHQQHHSSSSGGAGGIGSVTGSGGSAGDRGASSGNSHSFNGSDYGGDKEPLSPHTDRSFDDDTGPQSGKKPEWKRYKQYTRADMMCAIQCVREGMSALQASRKFGLPSRTLYDKVRKLNITTGRGTHRTPKRSPPSVESSAAFPYAAAAAAAAAHNYGQTEAQQQQQQQQLLSAMHEERERERERERESKERSVGDHGHGLPPTIPHSAAALLDHAFLQQALENRGGDIAGREALHAMALAAAAHAAANRMSSSSPPGSNGHASGARSPSPAQLRHYEERERNLIKREALDQDERDADDEDDQVEDLSLAHKRVESPYSSPTPTPTPMSIAQPMGIECAASVIMPPLSSGKQPANGKQRIYNDDDDEDDHEEAAREERERERQRERERERLMEQEQAHADDVAMSAVQTELPAALKRELLAGEEAQRND